MANLNPEDKDKGLYHKFNVRRVDGSHEVGQRHYQCAYFVLDLTHDPHAKEVMFHYASLCEDEQPKLAEDIRDFFKD